MKITIAALLACTASLFALPAHAGNNVFAAIPTAQPGCLPNASGRITLSAQGGLQHFHLEVFKLPPNTGFDVFIIQVPKAPFGMSWYQGDITTDGAGNGVADFVGVFSKETFMVAPGVASAPVVFPDDASSNPATPPIQMYHVGVWFDSPAAASAAGCASTVTKFNGSHNAGVQAINSSNFADATGPLRFFVP
jgi:hypothetical protein